MRDWFCEFDPPGQKCCDGVEYTVLQHDDHFGYLCDGKLYCKPDGADSVTPHCLDGASHECQGLTIDLPDHVHGPGCGHEVIPHGDHFDYLVGNELHHVAYGVCCPKQCIGPHDAPAVVRHGTVSVIRHRKCSCPTESGKTDDAAGIDAVHAGPQRAADELDSVVTHLPSFESEDQPVTTIIYAAGICCPAEIPLIENILKPLPGILQVDVAVVTKRVIVRHFPLKSSPATLLATLNAAQLKASLFGRHQLQQGGRGWKMWIPPVHILLKALLLLVSLLSLLEGPTGVDGLEYTEYVALGTVALGLPMLILKSLTSLRAWLIDIHLLMLIAVVGAVALQQYPEAGAVVFLFGLAEWLEDRCMEYARQALEEVMALQPKTALLANGVAEVDVEQVAVGTLLLVKAGAAVPLDATVVAGSSSVDESVLTGESAAVMKGPGDAVYGGTINNGGSSIIVRTTSTAEHSTAQRVAQLVGDAVDQQSPMERTINKFAKWYTPTVILSAILVAVIPIAIGTGDAQDWVYLALEVLVTACPCAILLSTPVTTVSALLRCARFGVLVKGAQHMESLARLKVVAMDKTGTLTEGHFQVLHYQVFGSTEPSYLLSCVAAVQRHSPHPIAAAVIGYAASLGVHPTGDVTIVNSIQGRGIVGVTEGVSVMMGNKTMMEQFEVDTSAVQMEAVQQQWTGGTICWITVEGELAGVMVLADKVRAESSDAVQRLRDMRLRVIMLTGDNQSAAENVGRQVGMAVEDIYAQLMPEDKLEQVAVHQHRYGPLAHVGDGINDAPALAAADVGIALGSVGTAVAVEAADVALFTDDLNLVAAVVKLGRRVLYTIWGNIMFSVGTKVVVLVLAALRLCPLWGAVLVDVGTALIVILNGMTLLRWTPRNLKGEVCAAEVYNHQADPLNTSSSTSLLKADGCGQSQRSDCCNADPKCSPPDSPPSKAAATKCNSSSSNAQACGKTRNCGAASTSCGTNRAASVGKASGKKCCGGQDRGAPEPASGVKECCAAKETSGSKCFSARGTAVPVAEPAVKECCSAKETSGKKCCGTKGPAVPVAEPAVKECCSAKEPSGKKCCSAKGPAVPVAEPTVKECCSAKETSGNKCCGTKGPAVPVAEPAVKECCSAKETSGSKCCGTKGTRGTAVPVAEPVVKECCAAKERVSVARDALGKRCCSTNERTTFASVGEPAEKKCCGAKRTRACVDEPSVTKCCSAKRTAVSVGQPAGKKCCVVKKPDAGFQDAVKAGGCTSTDCCSLV